MIRFTWLQSRNQTAVAFCALVITAIALAITGPHLVHLYNTNIATCVTHGNCATAKAAFVKNDSTLRTWLGILVIVIPGIIGLFWGAPLVARELETGTYRLAWTQSVTRTRWLAVKLAVVGLTGMVVAGLFSLMVTWWASPIDIVNANRFAPGAFDERGIVAIGYAAFAFVLGVTTGAIIRRTLPAMATTMVAFLTIRLTFIYWIRPHLIAPAHRTATLDPVSTGYGSSGSLLGGSGASALQPSRPIMPNAWINSTRIVDNTGHALKAQVLKNDCPLLGNGGPPPPGGHSRGPVTAGAQQILHDCVVKVGATYHELVTYQPANRYWTFQWYELAIFLGAALILTGISVWWVRRRLA
jgi:ABC-type transport system involved in multi-copper enzyme maturation permease subunit